ncbi:MAG: hypothetical protein D6731_21095 [Planctomycetota bacterium]|nr:MAG: hypothetical protein D6731_21095 [Planctomycetota bacterium]
MRAYVDWVLRRRGAVLAACALLSLLSGFSLSRGVLSTSVGRMLLGESARYAEYLRDCRTFGADQAVVVGFEEPAALAPEGRERLRAACERLAHLPGVRRVESILDARELVRGPGGLPVAVPVVPVSLDAAGARDLLARLARHPLFGGTLVGRDGRSLAVLVQLCVDERDAAEELPGLVRAVREAAQGVAPPERVRLVGFPVVVAEMLHQTVRALALTTPLVAAVLLTTVWLLFRRVWPAALSLAVSAVGVLWTMGLAVALEPQVNLLMAAAPGVILIVAFSDVVHLCSAYLLEIEQGLPRREAILAACAEVGRACVYTSLTTGLGFLCLSLIPTPAFRLLGVVLGIGVALSLLLAVTLAPLLFSLLPTPRPLRGGAARGAQAGIDRLLAAARALAARRPRAVVAAFALAGLLAAGGAAKLSIETDFARRLAPTNPVRRAEAWFAKRFVSSSNLGVFLRAPGELDDPVWLRAVARFEGAARARPEVESLHSLLDGIRALARALGLELEASGLPRDDAALRRCAALVLASGDPHLPSLVDPEARRLRLVVRTRLEGMRAAGALASALEAEAARVAGPERALATGLGPLLGQWLDEIVRAQQSGVLASSAIIAIVMALCLGSLRVGLASMPPNLFPLLAVAGCLGAGWGRVDSDAIALGFVALGIGVDDTIHFLTRLRAELGRVAVPGEADPVAAAVARTFAFAGRGIVMTTLILAAGFLPFLLSDYFLMRMLGSLLPLCLLVALAADLLLVPAMLRLGWIRFPARPQAAA